MDQKTKQDIYESLTNGIDPAENAAEFRRLFSYGVTLGEIFTLVFHVIGVAVLALVILGLSDENEWLGPLLAAALIYGIWITMRIYGLWVELKFVRDAWNAIRWARMSGVPVVEVVELLHVINADGKWEMFVSPPANKYLRKLLDSLAQKHKEPVINPSANP